MGSTCASFAGGADGASVRGDCAFAETCGSTSPYPAARSNSSAGFDVNLRTALCMQSANPSYKVVAANHSLDDEDILLPIPFKKFAFDRRSIPIGWRRLEDEPPEGFQLIGGDACIIEREAKEPHKNMVMRRVLVALPDWVLDFRRIRALVDLPGRVRSDARLCGVHMPIRYSDMEWTVIPIDYPAGEALLSHSTENKTPMKEADIKNLLFSLMQSVMLLADNIIHFYGFINPATLFLDRHQTLAFILPLGAMLSSAGAGSVSLMVHQSHGFCCAPEIGALLKHSNVALIKRLGMERERALGVDAYAASAIALWCFGEKQPSMVHKYTVAARLPMLARDLLQKALFADPDWRLSGADVLRHAWLKGCEWY